MSLDHDGAGVDLMARLDALAAFSSEAGALTRFYLTPEHKAAALQVQAWMIEAGMTATIDPVGSVVGRYAGSGRDGRTLIIGSHIDTVRNAGRFDGTLGVVAGIAAVARLHERGEALPFDVEVIAFGDEEGVRFPVTLTGSHAVAGRLKPAALDALDDHGISLREALRAFGCDPALATTAGRARQDILGYVEVHIEQGPVLEAEGLPVGVVSAIAGANRFKVEVKGMAGHAGTVPMTLRRDAFAAVAEMALAVETLARETPDLVGTVGRVEVSPGGMNVIPGRAMFTVDLRSPDDRIRNAAFHALQDRFAAVAARRGVLIEVTPFYDEPAAPCAPALMDGLAAAIAQQGLRLRTLPSGAGHDGLAMIALCPIAMLFVRCAGGISHNPAESITGADADVAVTVLTDFLRSFGPRDVSM